MTHTPGPLRGLVLKHCPIVGDHWKTYFSHHSTVGGLAEKLRQGVRNGRWKSWAIVVVVEMPGNRR